jgi:hypothetical protein
VHQKFPLLLRAQLADAACQLVDLLPFFPENKIIKINFKKRKKSESG